MTDSYIIIASSVVKKLAEERLALIQSIRKKDEQKLLEMRRAQYIAKANTWWGRLWKDTVPFDEEILRWEEEMGMYSEYNMNLRFSFHKHEKIAKKLLNASKYAAEISVSAEDLEYIV